MWAVILLITPWLLFYILWNIKSKKLHQIRVPILAYHQVSDKFNLSITRQKVSQFERGMRFLYEQGYKAVRLKEILDSDESHTEKKVAITFDDAFQDVYLNALPVLQKFNFTACIFVITGYVGKYNQWDYNWGRNRKRHLSWEQMKEMSDAGFVFGSHTVNHPDLTKISQQFVEYELKRSKEILEDKLGQRVDFLSYPFGRYNRYVQKEAERLGYKGAYTLCSSSRKEGHCPFSQKRWGVYLLDSPLTLKIKLNQGGLSWMEDTKGWIINAFPSWTVMVKGSPDYAKMDIKC
jgi:peptidoglycan/xylan/chitin deacetylase (PgdA/CDA1 family)